LLARKISPDILPLRILRKERLLVVPHHLPGTVPSKGKEPQNRMIIDF
jgi:hypothetical protein